MKKIKIVFFALLLSLSVAALKTEAVSLAVPEKDDPNVVVGSGQNPRNLYAVGSNVTVNGAVRGDLASVGGMVSVVGDVEQDILVVGGTLTFGGKVGGDARILGGNVTFSQSIGGDVAALGGNINFTEKAEVGGDLLIAGGNVIIDSPVKGNVTIAGGNVTINNQVYGNVQVKTSQKLVFGSSAEVFGKISHKGTSQALIKDGAKVPSISFEQIQKRDYKAGIKALYTAGFVIKLMALFFAAWLFLIIRPKKVYDRLQSIVQKPVESLGWGLVGLVVFPIGVILLFVTLAGYYVGLIALAVYVLMLLTACVYGVLLLGHWAIKYISKNQGQAAWQVALLGAVLYKLLQLIPFIGWLLLFLVFLMSLGQMVVEMKEALKNRHNL